MSIKDLTEKIKPFYFLLLFIVIAAIFFALGRLSAIEERHSPIKILQPASDQTASAISAVSEGAGDSQTTTTPADLSDSVQNPNQSASTGVSATGGEVIGSKTGNKYYFPWCSTVKRIKPENQVIFASIDLAKSAGYTPGGNCKGLQ
jgi:hypothetical protein